MSESSSPSNRPVWLAIIIIVGVLVAGGCALAFRLANADPVTILSYAGGAFVATVSLCLAVWKFLAG